MTALVNFRPLSCSNIKKFVTHFCLKSGGMALSQFPGPKAMKVSLRSSFTLDIKGVSLPNKSHTEATLEAACLLVRSSGTNFSISSSESPSKYLVKFEILPLLGLEKWSLGIFSSIISPSGNQPNTPKIPTCSPSLETSGRGGNPDTVHPLHTRPTLANKSSAALASVKHSSWEGLDSIKSSTYLLITKKVASSGFSVLMKSARSFIANSVCAETEVTP